MANSWDSNDLVVSYTTRRAYQMSLDWYRVSEDLNSVELQGSFVVPEDQWESFEKYDKIYLERSKAAGDKLLLFAFHILDGELHVFSLENGKVVRTGPAIKYDVQYNFVGCHNPGEIWMASRIGPMKQFIIR